MKALVSLSLFSAIALCLTGGTTLAKEGDTLWIRPTGDSVESTPAVDDRGNVLRMMSTHEFSAAVLD